MPVGKATLQLTATLGGQTAPPKTVTTNNDGSFSIPFNAPTTPGNVTFQATIPGTSPLISATATMVVGPTGGTNQPSTPSADSKQGGSGGPSSTGGQRQPALVGGIRGVDFQNFEYISNCLGGSGPASVVHLSRGGADNADGSFWADKPVFGILKSDGQEEAVVVLSCHPEGVSPNVAYSEVFIFEMTSAGAKAVAKLPSTNWKDERVTGVNISNRQLAVDFLEVGEGSMACPEWVVTSKFRWDGTRFVKAGESRRKNNCGQ
jgi:hypothetical protein